MRVTQLLNATLEFLLEPGDQEMCLIGSTLDSAVEQLLHTGNTLLSPHRYAAYPPAGIIVMEHQEHTQPNLLALVFDLNDNLLKTPAKPIPSATADPTAVSQPTLAQARVHYHLTHRP